METQKQQHTITIMQYILLGLATLIVILPIVVVLLGSFKTGEEFNRSNPFDLPKFRANNEVWKGAADFTEKSAALEISARMFEGHDAYSIVLVHDEAENGASVEIEDSQGRKINAALESGKMETQIKFDDEFRQSAKQGGVKISGKNCILRRVRITDNFFFQNYVTAFTKGNMLLGFWNTLILIFFSGLGTVLTGSMTAYVLSRFTFKMKKVVRTMFLWISLIPTITTQVATFQIIQKLHMYNTHLAVIVLSMGTDIIAIMIYLQFLNNISKSLDESAIIDGAGYVYVFAKIIFPLLQPATVTILILKCVNLYNDFYNPLLYMPKTTLQVISTSLYKFKGPFGTNWPVICAGVVIAVIPTFVLFIFLQKYIYNGMVTGSVKE